MIVASVHDPEIFAPVNLAQNMPLIVERLRVMLHGHVVVVDDAEPSVIMAALQHNLSQNITIQMMFNAAVPPVRIIRLPIDVISQRKIAQWVSSPGSAEVVALAGRDDIDVCVVDQQTIEAAKEEQIDMTRMTTLAQYHTTKAWQRENMVFGGTPLSEFTKADFLNKIVQPVVHWAAKLTIIDKMVGQSAFGKSGNKVTGLPSDNWPKFKETIQTIYGQWNSGVFAGKNRMTIIAEFVKDVRKNGQNLVGNDQAKELVDLLGIDPDRIHVLLKRPEDVRKINHDRYLVTNNGFTIGFTRGFDLIGDNEKLPAVDAYLRQDLIQQDPICQLMNATSGTQGHYP